MKKRASPQRPIVREESHCLRLPGGNVATCRDDGVVQIGNEEVTRADIILLAEHLKTCAVIDGPRKLKVRGAG